MDLYFTICAFVFGTIFGSFYNVVGDRLSREESIVTPRSHCPHCNHFLTPVELIPIISYLIQGGKCKNCHEKIPVIHPIYEFLCGIMFALTYYVFKFTPNFWLTLTLLSVILIIFVSDIEYMIIPDEVILVGAIMLFVERLCFYGVHNALKGFFYGLLASLTLYAIKRMGDKIFKRESMGGGDIKLMLLFGMTIGYVGSLCSVVIGSFVGLPIAYYVIKTNKSHEIPFGPLLGIGAIIVMFFSINMDTISYLLQI